jgi:hypothetical protein
LRRTIFEINLSYYVRAGETVAHWQWLMEIPSDYNKIKVRILGQEEVLV